MDYRPSPGDEVEDLLLLLETVKAQHAQGCQINIYLQKKIIGKDPILGGSGLLYS